MGEENTVGKQTIKVFTDLDAWKEGHKLVLLIYKLAKSFPLEERFALADQMRRAAISITSNIAEGFSRQSYKEKLQFYAIALGSITEIQNQLIVSKDLQYSEEKNFSIIMEQSIKVHKITNGLIRHCKTIIHNSKYIIHVVSNSRQRLAESPR
jgi:four helix bundle protein